MSLEEKEDMAVGLRFKAKKSCLKVLRVIMVVSRFSVSKSTSGSNMAPFFANLAFF